MCARVQQEPYSEFTNFNDFRRAVCFKLLRPGFESCVYLYVLRVCVLRRCVFSISCSRLFVLSCRPIHLCRHTLVAVGRSIDARAQRWRRRRPIRSRSSSCAAGTTNRSVTQPHVFIILSMLELNSRLTLRILRFCVIRSASVVRRDHRYAAEHIPCMHDSERGSCVRVFSCVRCRRSRTTHAFVRHLVESQHWQRRTASSSGSRAFSRTASSRSKSAGTRSPRYARCDRSCFVVLSTP